MFLKLDGTFWVQLINFAIFFAILRVVFLRPVGEAIRKRREYIDGVKSDYDRARQTVESLRAEAESKRSLARREAQEHFARVRSEGEAEAMRAAEQFAATASSLVREAHQTIAKELAAARAREPELAQALADSVLERALGAAP